MATQRVYSMSDKSALKYSLLLIVPLDRKLPDFGYLTPQPTETIVDNTLGMANARRNVITKATMPFSLILDADTTIPQEFLSLSHKKLLEGYVATTLMYGNTRQNHPPFGASFWLTSKLKELYDYQKYQSEYKPIYERIEDDKGNDSYVITNHFLCECLYMYAKLAKCELYVFTHLSAKHLKSTI